MAFRRQRRIHLHNTVKDHFGGCDHPESWLLAATTRAISSALLGLSTARFTLSAIGCFARIRLGTSSKPFLARDTSRNLQISIAMRFRGGACKSLRLLSAFRERQISRLCTTSKSHCYRYSEPDPSNKTFPQTARDLGLCGSSRVSRLPAGLFRFVCCDELM